jgi:hypothetical protein
MNKKIIWFIIVFAVLGLLAMQVPVAAVAGSKVKFTLFDSFGPIASGFLGTLPGVIAVTLMQLANFFIHGAKVLDAGTIIRFFPMLLAAAYFGKKGWWNWVVPAVAIIIFNLNPIGRSVWYYSLYWLIPIVTYFLRDRFLLARALGATFTAHAVGGAAWIWAFHLPRTVWIALIPVVARERVIFTFGIALMYLLINNLLALLSAKQIVKAGGLVNEKFVWKKMIGSQT